MARRHVELCRRFPPGEMTVSTVASRRAAETDVREGYPIERQPFGFRRANRFTNLLRWSRWVSRRARAVDLIHCGNSRPVGYIAWWTSKRVGKPYLLYVNGGDLLRERRKAESWLKRVTARHIFSGAAGVVANSRWTADLARDVMSIVGVTQTPPIAAIDLGTDPAYFHPARATGALRRLLSIGDAPMLLTVARLVPHKGQDVGIRALARLARAIPDLRYVLVGGGHDELRLRDLAEELGVANRVLFAGTLSDDQIAEAYATATVYIGLSRLDRGVNVEGFGISFVEAGASGTPSVAGDSGGVRSAVRDGETGIVVPPEDVEAVASAIRTLVTDPSRRDQMGRAARAAVESHYNWDRVARETREFAERVVQGPR